MKYLLLYFLTALSLLAVNATSGQSATFSVTVGSGTPPFTYQWLKQADATSPAQPISGATNASLVLANVTPGDTGIYSVVVANLAGAVTSDTATLTVLPVPPGGLSITIGVTTLTEKTP